MQSNFSYIITHKFMKKYFTKYHNVHWGINPPPSSPPPSKTPILFLANPALNLQTAKTPPFLGNAPYILVFLKTPLTKKLTDV